MFSKTINQGLDQVEKQLNKNNVGKRSTTKAKEMAQKIRVGRLDEITKDTTDAYKGLFGNDSECSEMFKFGSNQERNTDNAKCEINIEQMKEIGEIIGISWTQLQMRNR